MPTQRREFLQTAGVAAATLALSGRARAKKHEEEEEVSPTEDLMREHGVLRRLLLVYRDVIRRVDGNLDVQAAPISEAANIVRAFIEDYHERDEEDYVFPRLQKAGQLTELIAVLTAQHQAGRALTASIQRLATATALGANGNRRAIAENMRHFVRMYEPHAAREDTILFPAFVKLVSEKERHKLQEVFERKEKSLPLGDFEKMVVAVGDIEKSLGLYDLAQYTPVAQR
jgi:hemerythrin-like domain-containing protein